VETSHDERGIIWPKEASPFEIHLLNIAADQTEADKIYKALQSENITVLYDQRDVSAGTKFAESDLIGIPTRILVSDKTLKEDSVEIKDRKSGNTSIVKIKNLAKEIPQ
jgi:prolyl-tRNA synthetase